jgi:hypothetical protein
LSSFSQLTITVIGAPVGGDVGKASRAAGRDGGVLISAGPARYNSFGFMSAAAQVATLCGFSAALLAVSAVILFRIHWTPERRERKRRLELHRGGRLGEAMITEASADALYYSYCIRGVQYAASQDITALRQRLPADPERLIGFASLKYAPNNPANSILVCEEWSGVRAPSPGARVPGRELMN